MTRPTVIFLGPDGGDGSAKIYVRTLLYSTGHKGHVLDNMFLRVTRGETVQNFNIWVYGENQLSRGSGLFVGPSGVALNHHFLLPKDGSDFSFLPGDYNLAIYATTVGNNSQLLLSSTALKITQDQCDAIRDNKSGLFFDWGPDSQRYHAHIDSKPNDFPPPEFIKALIENSPSKNS